MHYFAPPVMRKGNKTYGLFSKVSAVLMALALLWLTVSTPFVFASQQKTAEYHKLADVDAPINEEESNPFGNSTEEKAPTGVSLSEEYLHDHHSSDYYFMLASQFHKF